MTMRAAWHCGSVAPIRADAALQGCAAFRIALLAPLLGAAPVKALPIWRGTGSSNPSPSSSESVTNLTRSADRRGSSRPGLKRRGHPGGKTVSIAPPLVQLGEGCARHPPPPRHSPPVFAKAGHVAAASRTGAGPVVHRSVHDHTARQVVRQGLSLWPVSFQDRKRPVFCRSLADLFGFADFQLLEPQFELLDVPGQ